MYFIKAVIYDYIKDDKIKFLRWQITSPMTTQIINTQFLQSYLAGEEVDFLTLDEKDNLQKFMKKQ